MINDKELYLRNRGRFNRCLGYIIFLDKTKIDIYNVCLRWGIHHELQINKFIIRDAGHTEVGNFSGI